MEISEQIKCQNRICKSTHFKWIKVQFHCKCFKQNHIAVHCINIGSKLQLDRIKMTHVLSDDNNKQQHLIVHLSYKSVEIWN